jgi:hypothetical protein
MDQASTAPLNNAESFAADEWRPLIDALGPLGERIVRQMAEPSDELLRHEMYRLLMSQICMAYLAQFVADETHPDFWPLYHRACNIFGPNPDMYYFQAPIAAEGRYLISGFRGTSLICDFQVGGGQFYSKGLGRPAHAGHNYDIDDLSIGPDGFFEVILSCERPTGWDGDWWKIDADTTNVHVRQISYDWLKEVDARFVIERLDTAPEQARFTAGDIAGKLALLPQWAENWIETSLHMTRADQAAGLVNRVELTNFGSTGGTTRQMYVKGLWDLAPDEALIIETDIPERVKYWSFCLNDLNYSVLDYVTHQASLNGHQARVDTDGRFRAVIAASDPGVPNWLDTCGYRTGAILGRWRDASSAPLPEARLVKLADVRDYLPSDTPDVGRDEREKTLRERSRGARLRRRW